MSFKRPRFQDLSGIIKSPTSASGMPARLPYEICLNFSFLLFSSKWNFWAYRSSFSCSTTNFQGLHPTNDGGGEFSVKLCKFNWYSIIRGELTTSKNIPKRALFERNPKAILDLHHRHLCTRLKQASQLCGHQKCRFLSEIPYRYLKKKKQSVNN